MNTYSQKVMTAFNLLTFLQPLLTHTNSKEMHVLYSHTQTIEICLAYTPKQCIFWCSLIKIPTFNYMK